IENIAVADILDEMPNTFDIISERRPDQATERGTNDADPGPREEEDAHHRTARGAHGTHNCDVPSLVLHQHDLARDDVEGGDDYNQRQDEKHHGPLDIDRREEVAVGLFPIADGVRGGAD